MTLVTECGDSQGVQVVRRMPRPQQGTLHRGWVPGEQALEGGLLESLGPQKKPCAAVAHDGL